MTVLHIKSNGTIELPEPILAESRLQPGSAVVVVAGDGRIVLIDREKFARQVEAPMHELVRQFQQVAAEHPTAPFIGDVSLEEYASLTEEEEDALWDRLTAEAEKTRSAERDIPAHFRPARQKRG